MVNWKELALIGGVAIAVGAVAQFTKAGEGIKQIAGGLGELVAAPIREGARAFGEVGLGIQQFGGGLGGAFTGVRAEIQAWIDMINKWQGVKPPVIEPGGCRPVLDDGSCPTDQAYERVNGECCWGKSLEARRTGTRGEVLPIPPKIPVILVETRPPCESYILPGAVGTFWRSGNVGFGSQADCEAYRAGGR